MAAPNAENKQATTPVAPTQVPELTDAIATIYTEKPMYTEGSFPPSLPSAFKKWKPQAAPNAPHDPNSYFPMTLVK